MPDSDEPETSARIFTSAEHEAARSLARRMRATWNKMPPDERERAATRMKATLEKAARLAPSADARSHFSLLAEKLRQDSYLQ